MMRLVFKSSAENSAVVPFFCSHRCGTPLVPAVQIWLSAFDYNGAMSARTAGYLEAIEHLPEGAILVVPGVSWEEYEELLGDLGARPGVRVSYDEGRLEIMSPLREHEKCKEFISDLARAFAEETTSPWKNSAQRPGSGGGSRKVQSRMRVFIPPTRPGLWGSARSISTRILHRTSPSRSTRRMNRAPNSPSMLHWASQKPAPCRAAASLSASAPATPRL